MTKPLIDLGYPTEAQGDLPAFHSIEEEAAFWDTHDLTDLSHLPDADEQMAEPNAAGQLLVLLDDADRHELDRQAKHKGMRASTLARIWLRERLHRDAKTG